MGVSIDTSCRGTELSISLRLLLVSSSSVKASSSSRAASELKEHHWLMPVPQPEYSAQLDFEDQRVLPAVVSGDSTGWAGGTLRSRGIVQSMQRRVSAHQADLQESFRTVPRFP